MKETMILPRKSPKRLVFFLAERENVNGEKRNQHFSLVIPCKGKRCLDGMPCDRPTSTPRLLYYKLNFPTL